MVLNRTQSLTSPIPVRGLLTLFLFLLLICLAGCGGGGGDGTTTTTTTTPASLSGIDGLAQITVSGGANYPGKPAPTPTPLAQATISVQPAGGGQEITRATTDANGHFQIALEPGSYLVVPILSQRDQGVGITAANETVVVSAGAYTSVVVNYSQNLP